MAPGGSHSAPSGRETTHITAATTTSTTPTTITAICDGPHGRHSTTVPVECPPEKLLRGLGHYYLATYATVYPLAASILAERTAKQAERVAASAEREARKASKGGSTQKASTGNEPGAVDTAKGNTPPATTVQHTTLATATVAQLVAELVSRHATDAALDTLGNMVGDAIDAARATLAKPAPSSRRPRPPSRTAPYAPPVHGRGPHGQAGRGQADPAGPAGEAQGHGAGRNAHDLRRTGQAGQWTWSRPSPTRWASRARQARVRHAVRCGVGKGQARPVAKPAPTVKTSKPSTQETAKPAPKADPPTPSSPASFDATGKPLTVSQV